jgi:uncharacterized protein (UPF0332 family)
VTEETAALLDKARRSLEAARQLAANGHFDFAVSRAYYAAFYAAEALLSTEDVVLSRHAGVIGEFNRRYVATGRLERRHGAALQDAFNLRNRADYATGVAITEAEATPVLRDTEALVNAVSRLLTQS